MTVWDALCLLMLLGLTVGLLIGVGRGSASEGSTVPPSYREPPEWAKKLVIVLILAGSAFLAWDAFQDPMKLTSSQRAGLFGPRGPVFSIHNYVKGVLGLAVPLWMLIAFVGGRARRSADRR